MLPFDPHIILYLKYIIGIVICQGDEAVDCLVFENKISDYWNL
jgi:hypothetical protein